MKSPSRVLLLDKGPVNGVVGSLVNAPEVTCRLADCLLVGLALDARGRSYTLAEDDESVRRSRDVGDVGSLSDLRLRV